MTWNGKILIKTLFFLAFIYQFSVVTSDHVKSSVAFVIDNTGSMWDDIEEVKNRANDIFDAVLKSEESQIENFVLVTFNDPAVELRTVTRDRDEFKRQLAKINVHGGGDCPEYCMSGIEKAITESLPGSYIYVFTDASAADYGIHERVKNLALKKSCQVVFVLTGLCGTIMDKDYLVYTTLAKATSGQVFHLGKSDVGDIINFVVESVKGRGTVLLSKDLEPGWNALTFIVDAAIDSLLISVSGHKPKVTVKDDKGSKLNSTDIVDKENVKVVKVINPPVGNITAEIESDTKTTVLATGKTTLNFFHGFSAFKPTSFNDTATRPPPDGQAFLLIKLDLGGKESTDVELKTVEILKEDESVVLNVFDLEIFDKEQHLYITKSFQSPDSVFKIRVNGIDVKTGSTINRISTTSLSRQILEKGIIAEKVPTISIEGEPKIDAEYDGPLKLKCYVSAYPKPDIIWEDTTSGKAYPVVVQDKDLPYDYIGILDLEKVNKNATYTCKATNSRGGNSKSVQIETVRKIFFNVIETPKDIQVKYKEEGIITCKIDANPPAVITWFKNDIKLESNDKIEISKNGSELRIVNMQPLYRGRYKCMAKNEFNEKVYEFKVTISGVEPPKIDKHLHEINVTSGGDVNMLCRLTQGIPEPTINWYHESTPENFVKLTTTEKIYYIKNAQPANSGRYKCDAVSIMGKDSHIIHLSVQYPPTIKNDNEVIRVKYEEEVTMLCEVDGVPDPTVVWTKNGAVLELTPTMHLYRDHSLKMKAGLNDRGLYECIATNHLGSANRSVLLDVYIPPTIQPPAESIINLKVGYQIQLPCRAHGVPKPTIKWIYQSVEPTVPPKNMKFRVSSLFLSHIQLNMAGYYTCIATNIGGSYNISYFVKVQAPPIIENSYLDKTFRVVDHDLVQRIECNATGSPKPEIIWKKDGRNIAIGTDWYLKDDDGALIIKNIDRNVAGTYACEAVNILGHDTEVYTVEVDLYPKQGPPKTTQMFEEDSSADIKCDVPHGPLDNLRWYKGDKLVTIGELTLTKARLSDTGVYTCRVSTFSGSSSGHTMIQVGYKPKFLTLEPEVYDIDETSTQYFICDAAAQPSPKITWWHNGEKINVTDMSSIYTIFEAKFIDRGTYYCEVTNEFGSINRTFQLNSAECIIDIREDLTGNSPIVIASPLKWPEFEITNGFIRVPKTDSLNLNCPSTFTHFGSKDITAFCESESKFKINGYSYKYSDIKCNEGIKHKVLETGIPCLNVGTDLFKIGFEIHKQFLPVYEVCFDLKNKAPLFTKHILNKYLADQEPVSPKWTTGDLSFNFDEIYNCEIQTDIISGDLSDWFHKDDGCCFARRQLVNPRDVSPGVAQMATYDYLNVVPQWSTCGMKNWDDVENRLRNLVKNIDYHLTVWTGTCHGLQLLNNESSEPTDIFLRDLSDQEQPVSQYLWKVVQDNVTRSSVAIIQVNIPDLSVAEAHNYVLCRDVCHEIEWMTNTEWHDVTKGYTYCCTLRDFERAFKINRIFYRGSSQLLYNVAMISERSLI